MVFNREWYVGFGIEDGLLYRVLEAVPEKIFAKFRWKNPDLIYIGKYGIIIIEVDGSVHDRKVQKTLDRNELYINAGIKLIVLNLANIKEINKTIFQVLDCEITKIMGGQCAEH